MSSSNPKSTKATLQALLKSSTPGKIQTCLLKSLNAASTEEREVLSVLLAPLTADAGVSLHCVRCHSTYTENKNHPSACKINHNDEGDSERTEIGYEDMTTTVACCGASFDSEEGPDTEYCFEAPHTTDVDAVLYYDKVDDDDDFDGVNQNVVSCESRRCFSTVTKQKRKAVRKEARGGHQENVETQK